MNTIITKGLGIHQQLVTQGYGALVIVFEQKAAGRSGSKGGQIWTSAIKTRWIKIPDEPKRIYVDVMFVKYSEDISVDVVLNEIKGNYIDVKAYLEKEVELYD